MRHPALLLTCLALAMGGCDTEQSQLECLSADTPAPGDSVVRRLTPDQFQSAVRDLVNYPGSIEALIPAASSVDAGSPYSGFGQPDPISENVVASILTAAEEVGRYAHNNAESLSGCDPHTSDATTLEACVDQFIERLSRRGYRRPATPDELATLKTVFDLVYLDSGFEDAIRAVVELVIQSPQFFYLYESGLPDSTGNDNIRQLSGYEVATRLSLMLWGTIPDEVLLDAAEGGALDTREGVAQTIEVMLADPRSRKGIMRFFNEWIGIDKLSQVQRDPELYPDWSDQLAKSMVESTERYIESVLWEEDGSFETLFSASHGYVNDELAELYGVNLSTSSPNPTLPKAPIDKWVVPPSFGESSPDSWHRVSLDPDQRRGLLAQPSVLAAHAHYDSTSVVHRGLLVLENLLCQEMPAPPDDVNLTLPPVSDDMTTRERYARHEVDPACSSCHSLIDPVGFAFEHYDAIGRWREYDGNYSVDATGLFSNTIDVDGEFYGADGLAQRVINSPTARECFAKNVYRYTFGKQESESGCETEALGRRIDAPDAHLFDVFRAIATSDNFRYRNFDEDTNE